MFLDRQITTETLYMTYLRETNDILYFEVDNTSTVDTKEAEIIWSSLSEIEYYRFVSTEDGVLNEFEMMCPWQCQLRILLFPLYYVAFKQTTCHLTAEANVGKFSHGRDKFYKLILTQTPSITWFR